MAWVNKAKQREEVEEKEEFDKVEKQEIKDEFVRVEKRQEEKIAKKPRNNIFKGIILRYNR